MERFLLLSTLILISLSCEKNNDSGFEYDLFDLSPEIHIVDMELNSENEFYYVTSEFDSSIEVPMYASYMPTKRNLIKKETESSSIEILDNDFLSVTELLFDKHDNLWSRSSKNVFLIGLHGNDTILKLNGDEGILQFMAVDNDNNIWIGGLRTGLYKIDRELNIIHFDTENSSLPSNSMNNIHIDMNNDVWIALSGHAGVLRISDDEWTVYNSTNSGITDQSIWCLVSDKNGDLWIGTGHDNENENLMKFDGSDWTSIRPQNSDDESVSGTVRGLYSDGNKIYVLVVQYENAAFSSNELLTFNGYSWEKISSIPDDDGIDDIRMDYSREVVWIRSLNKGIFQVDMYK